MIGAHLVQTRIVQEAADIIDESGVVAMVDKWEKKDQKYKGGRTTTLGTRALLIAWLVVTMEDAPLHLKRVAEVLSERLHPEAAELLGVPVEFCDVDAAAMYGRVDRATQRLFKLLDAKPLPTRNRRLLKAEWDDVLRDREERAKELEVKRRRFFSFANGLLAAQYGTVGELAHTSKVSLSVDATFLSANGKGIGKERMDKRRDDQAVSSEPDGGFYIRKYEQDDRWDGSEADAIKKRGYGWEYEFVSLISNDPAFNKAVPHVVIGFDHHKPGSGSNEAAREIFEHILGRGLEIDHVVGDQLYFPGSNAEVLQNFLRRHGAKLVMKYSKPSDKSPTKGEGTIQGEAHGAIQVEGRWFCPALPAPARNAMANFRRAVAADKANPRLSRTERKARKAEHRAQRDAQILQRKLYEMRPKEKPDARGNVPMMCPATAGTLSCPLKPDVKPKLPAGAVPLPVLNPPKAPGKVCTNKTSTSFHIDEGGKYAQHYRYGSAEWKKAHTYGRQVIESYNKSLKRAANSLFDHANRPLRGETAQAFLALLAVIGTNARHIDIWRDGLVDGEVVAPDARTRESRTARHTPAPVRKGRKGISARRRAQLGLPARAR